ncbi:helix-turn-helix transcriptional regulator [Conexibacter stalactiti]|uniref:Helix-turn-helix transcriptional regulator n=1 Tax=Conexibacter stalactiti TaxID=1940611 RepID=A0ABU4HWC7_9ACTN|nr:helix-turn-helix transcriptional regulator [Conexibacter stalactiti]MDW5597581.1 helix-turn-helix transcriptional regulator [Conexibacter stalactiti]MEC5038223.1 helix-turn-helix transcriptional regulator [Conexibacter stalactiti]
MEGRRRDRDHELPDQRTLLPLRVACAIGLCDSVVALSTAVLSRPQAVSIVIGLCWVAAWAAALATTPRWAAAVAAHGWVLVPAGLLALTPALFDGGYPGNLATQPMWIALVAAALAGWRVTLACGATLCAGKLGVFLATGTSLATLSPWHGEPSEATTATLAPLAVALLGLAGVAVLRHVLSAWTTAEVAPVVSSAGGSAGTAAVAARVAPIGAAPTVIATGESPERPLSPAETAVVALLADGLTPKQIAHARGTSLATVRTQIKRAKRATSARTLDELVASAWRPG